jgi:hypothetical protein
VNPYAMIRIDVYQPDHGDNGLIYSAQRGTPLEWLLADRFDGYTTYEFQEMLAQLRTALKGATP